VERDQQLAVLSPEPLGDPHPVTERAKDSRPAKRGDAVSEPASRWRRAYEQNLHQWVYSRKIPLC
jgi:hypothetical protein